MAIPARYPAITILIAMLTACAFRPGSLGAGTGPEGGARVAQAAGSARDQAEMGRLVLAIRWPEGPGRDLRGYHAQLIPDSTATLRIKVTKNSVDVITPVDVNRPTGQAVTNAVVPVRADTGLVVTVEARETDANGTKVAEASQVNVAVVSSKDTAMTLTLGSLYAPTITGLSPTYARKDDPITVSGIHLAKSWRTSGPTVLFPGTSGTIAATPTSVADGTLVVTVPDGATSGNIQVKTDGVTGGSAAFEIGATLTINTGGTIPTSVSTYQAKVERDADTNGSYETTLYNSDSVAAGSMPITVAVPQGSALKITLDGYPASNAPAANGGSIAVGTSTLTVNSGSTTATTTPSLASRYAPAIVSVDDTTPAPDQSFTITGTNLGGAWRVAGPTVNFSTFGASVSATPTAVSDTDLTVTMPGNAIEGAITVTIDGLESAVYNLAAGAGITSYSGTFNAPANSVSGTAFQALNRTDLSCAFSVDGADTWSVDDPFYPAHPATGRDGVYPPSTSYLPGSGYKGALIVQRGTGTWQYVGLGATIAPTGGETLRFQINDNPDFRYRHVGSLTIAYTCTLQ